MMLHGSANFKFLGAECEIYVRQMSPNRAESRLISSVRKISRASAGFAVELDYTFPIHTLVVMDVKFPGQPYYYRSRGVVEWQARGDNPEKPYRLGVRVLGMEKLDPSGIPMTPPNKPRRAAITPTARVSRRADAPTLESRPPRPPSDGFSAQTVDTPQTAAQSIARTTELKRPKPSEISEILTSLIGEKIGVSKSTDAMDKEDIAMVGAYKVEDGRIVTLVGMDIALANWLGAALAMIPREVAKKDIEAATISEESKENTQEILNINTSVFNGPGFPHHRFLKLFDCFKGEQPPEVRTLMADPTAREDFAVEVPGYGAGRICCLLDEWHANDMDYSDSLPPADAAPPTAASSVPAPETPSPEAPEATEPPEAAPPPEPEPQPEEETPSAGPSYTINPPKASEIAELFTNLIGESVTVDKSAEAPLEEDEFAVIGDFLSDNETRIALCALDIQLANRAAAALAMIPKDVIKSDIENGKLSEESRDNIQEILNIAASIFNKPGMPHLRFGKALIAMDEAPPADYRPILSSQAERCDFTVTIPGYGYGRMACMFREP